MFFVSVPQYLSTEPFNPLKSYLHRFFDFLGGDRAFGEHSEHSDSLTANSLTPNHYFYGLLRIFLENWENHFKFVGAYCIYCVPLSHLCLSGAVRVPLVTVCLLGQSTSFRGCACAFWGDVCLFGWACVAFGLRGGLWCA